MATVAPSVPPTKSLEEAVSSVPPGVVLPPPDIRKIVETTAGYVARNGAAFETRMRNIEANNPRFSFLDPTDAYNSFYTWRLSEIKEGRGTDISAGRIGAAGAAAGFSNITKAAPRKKGPDPPTEFEFSAKMPNISAQDLDILKLTARFAAKNGRGWITALSQREARNFQFDFLHPHHSLHPFFNKLVDQYVSLVDDDQPVDQGPSKRSQRLKELHSNVENRFHILHRARQRAEWLKHQETQRQKKEEESEKEKLLFMQIDWHDFVVVETVLFTENDERIDLPPPTSLSDLQTASLEQKAMMSLAPTNMRIEEAMPTADLPELSDPSPQSVTSPLSRQSQTTATSRGAPAPMKIRNDYVPQTQPRRQEQKTAMCPKCKQQIDLNEWEQHMRVELLDPEWRAQKAAEASRLASSYSFNAYASIDIANNLKRLASQRSDGVDTNATNLAPAGLDDQQQLRNKVIRTSAADDISGGLPLQSSIGPGIPGPPVPPVLPSGPPSGQDAHGMSIQDQIKRLHQKYGGQ